MAIPQISLNNNVEIPQLGFGVYQVDPAETERVVSEFFQMFDVQVSIFLYHLHTRPTI